MLENLPSISSDPLFDLIRKYGQDQRTEKMDLLVGVYRDEHGQTPVMKKVQQAEQFLAAQATSKAYRILSGNLTFNQQMAKFLLGDDHPRLNSQWTMQTVGASAALRVLGDFIAQLSPQATVWNTEPGYINHRPIMEGAGLNVSSFRWQNKEGQLDIEACFADLEAAKEGDILLLHGCCHNPTGIDPTFEQWQQFSTLCQQKKLIPFIDIAYQGFGATPEEDAAGLRLMIDEHEQVLVTASCSKNMGLYCERTGVAMVMASKPEQVSDVRAVMERITRKLYSMPPHHGSAIASYLFDDPQPWLEELASYRQRVIETRQTLCHEFEALGAPSEWQAIANQKGMFSLLPLTPEQMGRLQSEFGIYGLPNGRVNLAGLKPSDIATLAQAMVAVC
ncbi:MULTISPECIES: aromatic amino acid transaminase [unclassified Vibrio]|uniref:Aromatic amino acid transaminase n=1 Tax=Vibrio sp. HB236076 TaxID=3232307 RepID=A0AB39HF38_9VIBR|nr:aromatic amino acid transaminase [Vibrio sp. HB161653]MDP5254673.1 aromatic amino acid transaminase [Vibrio sp. HB161653]